MAAQKEFTLSQVAQHKSKTSCWIVIRGRVLDVTEFLEEHPGGDDVLVESAGRDATKDFEDIGHSKAAQKLLLKYQVGVLQGHKIQDAVGGGGGGGGDEATYDYKPKKEMTAFVIKEESTPKYVALLEFFVPLLVASFFFAYRYLAA